MIDFFIVVMSYGITFLIGVAAGILMRRWGE